MAAETELNVRVTGRDELSPTLSQLESRVIRVVGAISASLAAIRITTAPVVAAAQFERELANVEKTTNFTTSQIRELSDELQRISTRIDVSTLDLTKIAAAAGQQGLGRFGVEGVAQFTESVARMSSVLDITAEEAAVNIGKIANIFKIPLSQIENAVSTFNQVSNNSTASGEELLDVVRRIGDAAGVLTGPNGLQQSIALAATGLDFGVSPEVVGTSFTKIFSSLRERADEFAGVLKIGTTEWINLVEQDGLQAFQSVLAAFRTLDAQSQQTAIVKLFGGGRIGALVNKLIQDTQDAVLTRNFEQALEGAKGTSAIEEQETVLNTLIAQSRTALNSLFNLATDVTGQSLEPLTEYVAQLNQALQSDGLRSFLEAVVAAALELVEGLVDAVKFVASLNVNWENFIRVVQVFLGLKLAEFFGGALLRSASGFAESLNRIRNGTDAVAASSKALAAAQAGSAAAEVATADRSARAVAARILGIEELNKKYNESVRAAQAVAVAEREVAAAAASAQSARSAAAVSGGRATAGDSQLRAASDSARAQRAALAAAEAQAQAAQVAVQNTLAQRIQAAQERSNERRLAIEQDYQTRLAAIRATGTRVGLTALRREREQALALEESSYQRSLRSLQSYYARRATEAAAGSQALIVAERAALAQRLSALDGALANQSGRAVNAAAQAAQAAAAEAALASATARLGAATTAANLASAAWRNFGVVARAVGTVVATAGRLIASGFFWITLVYTIADATGLLDKFGISLQGITDFLGFTSAAQRAAAIEDEKRTKALRDQIQAIDDLIEKNRQYVDQATGQVNQNEVGRLTQIASTSEDASTRQQAIAGLEELARSLQAERDRILQSISINNPQAIAAAKKDIEAYNAEIARLLREQEIPQINYAANGQEFTTTVDNSARIDELRKKADAAAKSIKAIEVNSTLLQEKLGGLGRSYEAVGAQFAKFFTKETLEVAQTRVRAFAEEGIKLQELKKIMEDTAQAAKGGGEEQKLAADTARIAYENLRAQQAATLANLIAYANAQQTRAKELKLGDDVVNSWAQFKILLEGMPAVIKGVIDAASTAQGIGVTPDGSLANPGTRSPTSGDNQFKPQSGGGESRARKEERARLALARARIKAENDLLEEQQRQALDAEERLFQQGLRSFRNYYDERRRIQLQSNQFDIVEARAELNEVEISIQRAKTKAEKDQFRATAVGLQGQINVLEERRKAIEADVEEERRQAEQNFADRLREEVNRLRDDGILPADTQTRFQGSLDELLASYRVFIAQLRSEGQDAVADSLIRSFRVEALTRSLEPVRRELDISSQVFERFQSRLQIAQQTGLLTTNQFLASQDVAIDAQVRSLQQFIEQQEIILRQNADLAGTNGYRNLVESIEDARLELEQLRAEQNQAAIEFNRQTTSTLSNVLGNLRLTTDGIQDALFNLFTGIVQNIQTTLGNSIAESITQSLGQAGTGGLGGWIQGLMQGPDSLAAGGLAQRGADFTTPLFVRDVSKVGADGIAGKVAGEGKDVLGDFIKDKGLDEAVDAGEGLLDGPPAEGFFAKFGTTVGGIFESLSGNLGGLFSGLLGTLGSLFSGLIAAIAGSSGGGGLLAAGAAAFGAAHTGGIAGQPKMFRRVSPAVFGNAISYHNGGIAGLAPNEVPTILEEGEVIRTQAQEKALQAQLNAAKSAGAEAGGGGKGVRVVLVDDRSKVPEAMNSPEGDQVFVQQARRNIATLKQLMR